MEQSSLESQSRGCAKTPILMDMLKVDGEIKLQYVQRLFWMIGMGEG